MLRYLRGIVIGLLGVLSVAAENIAAIASKYLVWMAIGLLGAISVTTGNITYGQEPVNIAETISYLKPGAKFVVWENDRNRIVWNDKVQVKPTWAEIKAAWPIVEQNLKNRGIAEKNEVILVDLAKLTISEAGGASSYLGGAADMAEMKTRLKTIFRANGIE